jgi:DoxX
MAYASAMGEVCFPVLLVLGLGTRYAALGLMGLSAIIQMTVPDGWQNFHLPWASIELAILTFGPGKVLSITCSGSIKCRGRAYRTLFLIVGRARRRSACFWPLAEIR